MNKEEKRRYIQSEMTKLGAKLSEELGLTKKPFPQNGDQVWRVTSGGRVTNYKYSNTEVQRRKKNFIGMFKTRKEAEDRLELLKQAIGMKPRWTPNLGEVYFTYYDDGEIVKFTWRNDVVDRGKFINKRVFKTLIEASNHYELSTR